MASMSSSCLACSIACKCRWLSSSAIDGAARDAAANDGDSFERGEVACVLVGDEKKPPEILFLKKPNVWSRKKKYVEEFHEDGLM